MPNNNSNNDDHAGGAGGTTTSAAAAATPPRVIDSNSVSNRGSVRSNSTGRSWLEGTLDVISGMAPRPSTPVGNSNNSSSGIQLRSAPSSPMRNTGHARSASGSTSGGLGGFGMGLSLASGIMRENISGSVVMNGGNGSVASSTTGAASPSIRRLPSQDSLDRSIHNESSDNNGNKSTAQIIRDLRQSNARLTARTAELEADFMNQLHAANKTHQEETQHLRERVKKSEKLTLALENRIHAANVRVKERDDSLQRLREESAFQRHQISEYRTQLQTLQQGDDGDGDDDDGGGNNNKNERELSKTNKDSALVEQFKSEKQDLLQQLGEMKRQSAQQGQEKTRLQTEVARLKQTVRDLVQQQQPQQQSAVNSKSSNKQLLMPVHSLCGGGGGASVASEASSGIRDGGEEEEEEEPNTNKKSPPSASSAAARNGTAASKMLQDLQWTQAELERTQEALEETQEALDDAQAQAKRTESLYKKQLVALRNQLQRDNDSTDDANNNVSVDKEEKESCSARDVIVKGTCDTNDYDDSKAEIAALRAKVLDYSHQLTAAQESLCKFKEQAEAQEQYRREEAEDLRVLNDAQEEEIETLRIKLSDALKKVASREQELEQRKAELGSRHDEMAVIEESSKLLNEIQGRLEESQTALQELSDELQETKQSHEDHVSDLSYRMTRLQQERHQVQEQLATALHDADSIHDSIHDQVERLTSKVRTLEKDKAALETRLHQTQESLSKARAERSMVDDEIRRQISELEYEKETMESEFQAKLIAKETEMLAQQHNHDNESASHKPPSGESTADHAREVADLQVQIQTLRQELKQAHNNNSNNNRSRSGSGGYSGDDYDGDDNATLHSEKRQSGGCSSYEDDLRKQVSALKSSETELLSTLTLLRHNKETEISELREKLSDRDTTISALVKSSVSLEQQMASAQVEMDLLRAKLARAGGRADDEEGVDVILAKGQDIGRMQSSLDAYRETEARLTNDLYRLKKQLHHTKVENGRLRKQLDLERCESVSGRSNNNNASGDDDATHATMGGGSLSSITPQQLKERDEAIARLVKQSMKQEKKINELMEQLNEAALEIQESRSNAPMSGAYVSPAAEEVEQLRQETEMFAGQVIEQDEEIEALKNTLREREEQVARLQKDLAQQEQATGSGQVMTNQAALEERIVALMNEVNDLKSRPMADGKELERIRCLEAEIDELKESNAEQLAELRVLRKSARDGGSVADEIALAKSETAEEQNKAFAAELAKEKAAQELNQVQAKLEEAQEQIKSLELNKLVVKELQNELVERDRLIGDLKTAAPLNAEPSLLNTSVDELELEAYKDEIESLKNNLAGQTAALDMAKKTIRELETMLAEKNEHDMAQFEEEKEELIATVEDLTNQLNEARDQLSQLDKDKELIDDFKEKLELADEAREESEKSIVETYERKLALLNLNKDVTIDNLRKELVAEKEESADEIEQLSARIVELEAQAEELKERATQEIQQREQRIFALEHTLEASKQLVGNMRTEMDHLQGSMVNAAAGRREEIEDMQQELVDLTATAARQERELTAARMQLEEKHLAYQGEVAKLRETIEMLESQAPEVAMRNANDLKMELRVREVKDRLEKLKFRNLSLQEENTNLRGRLHQVETSAAEAATQGQQVNRVPTDPFALAVQHQSEREKNEEKERIAELEERTNLQVEKIAELEKELESARSIVVTPAPPLPPTMTLPDKKSRKVNASPLRIGFLRRKGNGTSPTGGATGTSDEH